MSSTTSSNKNKKRKPAATQAPKAAARVAEPGQQPVTDPVTTVSTAKRYPQKLKSGEIHQLQRTMGNLAVRRLLVTKTGPPAVQRQGDPFAPFKHPDKGPHDYRLNADFDPAPRGWVKKQHNNINYYYHPKQGWERSHPVILQRGMSRYERQKFKDAVKELQRKLQVALGGKRKSGIWRADGLFGTKTRSAVRKFQKAEKLKVTGMADYNTWSKVDERGSAGVSRGRVSYAYEETLVGSTPGVYGHHATYGWAEKDKKLDVTVAVKFTNLPAEGPNVAKWIQNIWNIFKVTYKKDKDGKKRRNKDTSLDLNFVLKPTAGNKGPTIYPDNQVLLWRGDHPNWKNRGAGWPVGDKKTRSDAANWNLDDPQVKLMVGHEFGHLIGLEDEYARNHKDIQRLTGKTPLGTTDKEKLTPAQAAKYKQLVSAMNNATDTKGLKAVNTLVWGWKGIPSQMQFLAEEYKKDTGKSIDVAFHDKVKAVTAKALKEDPSLIDMIDAYFDPARKGKKKIGYDALVKLVRTRRSQEALQQWTGKFPDGNQQKVWWNFWASSTREYVTGGLMGDYSLLTSKKAEVRPNAVAHTHQHPLEPRHVRRFAEYVSRYKNNEVWEAEYR